MKPRMEASLGPCNWDTTGLSVHKTEVWLAASFDAECSHGVLELKVTAALAHTWFENGNNGAIPELPWGLNKQPKCAQPWEVFDPISNTFVQCPKEWVTKGVGPAKFSHFIQMMIQTCIARSCEIPWQILRICLLRRMAPWKVLALQNKLFDYLD